uniref:Uncharacterized protein n=1 Tax=Haptolina brevifila TaxID=156173 RepID=A0A7S2IFU4_9EUKA
MRLGRIDTHEAQCSIGKLSITRRRRRRQRSCRGCQRVLVRSLRCTFMKVQEGRSEGHELFDFEYRGGGRESNAPIRRDKECPYAPRASSKQLMNRTGHIESKPLRYTEAGLVR